MANMKNVAFCLLAMMCVSAVSSVEGNRRLFQSGVTTRFSSGSSSSSDGPGTNRAVADCDVLVTTGQSGDCEAAAVAQTSVLVKEVKKVVTKYYDEVIKVCTGGWFKSVCTTTIEASASQLATSIVSAVVDVLNVAEVEVSNTGEGGFSTGSAFAETDIEVTVTAVSEAAVGVLVQDYNYNEAEANAAIKVVETVIRQALTFASAKATTEGGKASAFAKVELDLKITAIAQAWACVFASLAPDGAKASACAKKIDTSIPESEETFRGTTRTSAEGEGSDADADTGGVVIRRGSGKKLLSLLAHA